MTTQLVQILKSGGVTQRGAAGNKRSNNVRALLRHVQSVADLQRGFNHVTGEIVLQIDVMYL